MKLVEEKSVKNPNIKVTDIGGNREVLGIKIFALSVTEFSEITLRN